MINAFSAMFPSMSDAKTVMGDSNMARRKKKKEREVPTPTFLQQSRSSMNMSDSYK